MTLCTSSTDLFTITIFEHTGECVQNKSGNLCVMDQPHCQQPFAYDGTVAETISGHACISTGMEREEQLIFGANNYCRSSKGSLPHCYTSSGREHCFPSCSGACFDGFIRAKSIYSGIDMVKVLVPFLQKAYCSLS